MEGIRIFGRALALATAVGLAGGSARATTFFEHGTACVPESFGSTAGKYNNWGIRNDSASVSLFYCPVTTTQLVGVGHTGGFAYVYDRSPLHYLDVWLCDYPPEGTAGNCLPNFAGSASGNPTQSFTGADFVQFIPSPAASAYIIYQTKLPPVYNGDYSHMTTFHVGRP